MIVPKPGNEEEIRMCVDMRGPNQAIKRIRHVTPTIDDIFQALNGMKIFSKLDLRNGYHQLVLDSESKSITTFSTHCGLYRYKRLNFGMNAAAEIFQNTISQVLSNIVGVINISDDIIVAGKNVTEHNKSLISVLERLKRCQLTINDRKCMFGQSSIKFFGYILTDNGVYPDPDKVIALQQMGPPANQSECKSLLGMLA